MVTLLIYGWIFVILLLMLINEQKGIALFIPYVILMPFYNPTILYVVVFIFYLFAKFRKHELHLSDITPFKPLLLYFLLFFCLIPFQSLTPKGVQVNFFYNDFFTVMTLPIIMWWEMKTDGSSFLLFRKVILICILIVAIYGLFLTLTPGSNPYLYFLMESIGLDNAQDLQEYTDAGDGRLFGRISSVFIHPMTFGLFMGLSLTYWLSVSNYQRDRRFYVISTILVVMIVLCGVRSALAALFVVAIVYLFFVRKLKLSLRSMLFMLFGIYLIMQIPFLSTYIGSIFGGSNDDVSGSSLEMRLMQYAGCLDEFMDSPLLGKGYGWHKFYISEYGDHPILLAFESLVYVVLCDGGLLGVLIWIGFIVYMCIVAKLNLGQNYAFVLMLLSFYFFYSCITGEFGYMKYFMFFYILLYYDKLIGEQGFEQLNGQEELADSIDCLENTDTNYE